MNNEIDRAEERHGMHPGIALLLGLGIGIIGTVVAIAVNEEQFGRAVRSTKRKAREVATRAKHRYDEALTDTRHRAADVADKVEVKARKLSEQLSD